MDLAAGKEAAMRATVLVTGLVAGAMMLAGCGGDGGSTGTNPKPVTGVSLDPDQMDIEVGHARQITPTVNGDNKSLTWYVNGIENGNEVVGEISENSPVTYTAPNWLPDPATVVVKAVSVEDSSVYDSCMVTVTFDKLFVDPVNGNDANNGCINLPFRTLTHAADVVDSGGTIVAQPVSTARTLERTSRLSAELMASQSRGWTGSSAKSVDMVVDINRL
jgi:hypothetical protein